MITAKDMYNVLSAVVPLYVAMFLAYGSVKWWKIFTPDQCSGINRFVTIFAIPLLSFHFISTNNIYTMNYKFVAADSLQKAIILMVLGIWTQFGKTASLEWMISLFALSTLPNTLVMGIPLLEGMYGDFSGSLMVQVVVLQSVIWYTLMLALFEYRGAKVFIMEQFPDRTAAEIVSVRVDWDIVSLDGREPLETDTEVGDDGKVHVTVRRSTSSRSHGLESIPSLTPRLSNLTDAEIYSLPSPGGSTFNHTDFYSNFKSADMYSINSSREPTPRTSNIDEEVSNDIKGSFDQTSISGGMESYITPNRGILSPNDSKTATKDGINMSLRSSNTFAVSDVNQYGVPADNKNTVKNDPKSYTPQHYLNEGKGLAREPRGPQQKAMKVNVEMASPNRCWVDSNEQNQIGKGNPKKNMPGASVMTRLILMMVWRKLIRNPNTYSSVLGLIWSLVAYKWNIEMPKLVYESISILSDAGLGMAMFSLGLFMALQPRIIACGKSVAALAMTVRFVTGPAVMAAASIAVGLRGPLLQVAIVQAALPQGIVPFVFAKEYNVHPEILSTAVIFGMLIAMPITLLYYALLGL